MDHSAPSRLDKYEYFPLKFNNAPKNDHFSTQVPNGNPQANANTTRLVELPAFILRKLYQRGSLRQTDEGQFSFRIQNPLATATVMRPPRFVINGVRHRPEDVRSELELHLISEDLPLVFSKGTSYELSFQGHLLKGANRIHMTVQTKEFGQLELFVEDRESETAGGSHVGEEE